MYGVSRKLDGNKKVAARCFLFFFLLIGSAHLLVVMRQWFEPVYSIVFSNAIYLFIFYLLYLGMQTWYRIPISRRQKIAIAMHIAIFTALMSVLFLYNENSLTIRCALAYINNAAILIGTIRLCLKQRAQENNGETIIIYTFLAIVCLISLPLCVMLTVTQDTPYIFMVTVMLTQNIVIFITMGGLLSLFMYDQVSMHYQRSIYDELTGIHNRRYFLEHLTKKLNNAQSLGYIALIDIDHFKMMNDQFGHDMGDIAIQKVVTTVEQLLHSDMVFGRYGGEEFILYIPSRINPHIYLESLRANIANIIIHSDDADIKLTISIGFSVLSRDEALDAIIKKADISLYRAKHAGRNCVIGWEALPTRDSTVCK